MTNKKILKLDATAGFLIAFLIVQVLGYISGYLNGIFETNINVISKLFLSLNSLFTSNWTAFTVLFVFAICTDSLYHSIKINNIMDENDIGNRKLKYIKYVLMIINIAFCMDFFYFDKFSDKISLIIENPKRYTVLVVILLLIILITFLLKKLIESHNAKNCIHNEIQNRNIDLTNVVKEKRKNFSESDNEYTNFKSVDLNEFDINISDGNDEILKHPILYTIENRKLYYAKKKAITYVNKLNKLNKYNQNNTSDNDTEAKIFIAISILFIIVFIALIVLGFIKIDDDSSLLSQIIGEFGKVISELFSKLTKNFNETETIILGFFLSIGGLILLVISFLVVTYAFTFIIQSWIYIKNNINNNQSYVANFVNKIKCFFYGAIDSVMRLLLFLPDFLETVEKTVLDSDDIEIYKGISEDVNEEITEENSINNK